MTGASRGLGEALTGALVERGWQVVVSGRSDRLLDVARRGGPAVTAVLGDVTDPVHRDRLVAAAALGDAARRASGGTGAASSESTAAPMPKSRSASQAARATEAPSPSAASRDTPAGPSRLAAAFASMVATRFRRRRCPSISAGKRSCKACVK